MKDKENNLILIQMKHMKEIILKIKKMVMESIHIMMVLIMMVIGVMIKKKVMVNIYI